MAPGTIFVSNFTEIIQQSKIKGHLIPIRVRNVKRKLEKTYHLVANLLIKLNFFSSPFRIRSKHQEHTATEYEEDFSKDYEELHQLNKNIAGKYCFQKINIP